MTWNERNWLLVQTLFFILAFSYSVFFKIFSQIKAIFFIIFFLFFWRPKTNFSYRVVQTSCQIEGDKGKHQGGEKKKVLTELKLQQVMKWWRGQNPNFWRDFWFLNINDFTTWVDLQIKFCFFFLSKLNGIQGGEQGGWWFVAIAWNFAFISDAFNETLRITAMLSATW